MRKLVVRQNILSVFLPFLLCTVVRMSKCRINKYKNPTCTSPQTTSQNGTLGASLNASLQEKLAARDAQDAQLWTIVKKEKTPPLTRKEDIDMILNGD